MKNLLTSRNFLILLFFITFLLGLALFNDYGVSNDEEFHRNNATFWLKYIKAHIQLNSIAITQLENIITENIIDNENFVYDTSAVPNIQSVPLPLIYEFIVDFLNIKSTKSIYQYKHLYNFIIYFIGLYFFYKLIYERYKSYFYSVIGILFLILTPRFFAESFYNVLDIFFVSLTIINMFCGINFLKEPNLKNTLFFSASSALIIVSRIMGLIPVILILFFLIIKFLRSNLYFKKNIKYLFYFIVSTFIIIIIFWPFLWTNPFNNFIFALSEMSSANFKLTNLYMGEYISSTNVPWHYHTVWIVVTTPTIVLLLFFLGSFFLLKRLFTRLTKVDENKNDIWRGDNEMFDLYFFSIIFFSILLFIKKGMGYDGWRHLYFIYPAIIMISLYFFNYLHLKKQMKIFKHVFYLFILFNLSYLTYWNFKFHPHQNVYFNFFFKDNFQENFDLDYWGLSNHASLKYIIDNNRVYPAIVATKSFSALERNLVMFDEEDKNKISITYDLSKADFIITNYRKRIKNDFFIDKDKYSKYYEILIDGVPINTVYKKKF